MSALWEHSGEVIDRFEVASRPGNERLALARVAEVARSCGLPGDQLERLKTAVAEATMNGIEHGNGNREELPVEVTVTATPDALVVSVTDQGGGTHAASAAEAPDLDLKLEGLQPARGWGLFLIGQMVDEMSSSDDGERHTVHLLVRRPTSEEGSGP